LVALTLDRGTTMLFQSWSSLLRISVSAAAVYVLMVAALRLFGSKALAKMSGYDLIISVAIGSLVAAIPITTGLALSDGIAAAITLLLLQELTRRWQARSLRVHHLVRERPHLVVWDGQLLEDRLKEISTSADEVRAAVRRAGLVSLSQVQTVVLENDGDWSVIPRSRAADLSALDGLDVPGHPHKAALAGDADVSLRTSSEPPRSSPPPPSHPEEQSSHRP
jgi:uncharacterized membrane protein YcaP (DUF421 family)